MDLLSDITARITQIRAGGHVRPPLLVLGTSERVGSNWLADTLGANLNVLNEPLRQQLDASHPLAPLGPHPRTLAGCDADELGPLGRHALALLAASNYAEQGQPRRAVKETNLYGAIGLPLGLWPDAPVVVASRSPLGVVSSFARGRLWQRFDYPRVYARMTALVATHPAYRRWAPLFPEGRPTEQVALVRLIVVNTVLLAEALAGRTDVVHVPYETAVEDQETVLTEVTKLIGEPLTARPGNAFAPSVDAAFGTAAAQELVAYLDERAADRVRATTRDLLDRVASIVPEDVAANARRWLAGAGRYRRTLPRRHPVGPSASSVPPEAPAGDLRTHWVQRNGVTWRSLLVRNDEFVAFLNALAAVDLPNTIPGSGTHLLCVPMPAGRGGRLYQQHGRWTVSTGYGTHPAYWVTWIGAAAFAAWFGARLPLRCEATALADDVDPAAGNIGYQVGDVVGVIEPGREAGDLHHPVGNVMLWCADGPGRDELAGGPAARWLTGAAWNTPGTAEQVRRAQPRHLTGASRGVGIRLVLPENPAPVTPREIASILRAWMTSLDDRGAPLADLDERLIAALQPDVGLGAHVGASAGPA